MYHAEIIWGTCPTCKMLQIAPAIGQLLVSSPDAIDIMIL